MIRFLSAERVYVLWRRLVLKLGLILNYHRERNRIALLIGEQALTVHQRPHQTEAQQTDVLPKFTRVLTFKDQKFVVGKERAPGEGRKDATRVTHNPTVCQHPSDRLQARGGRNQDRWWTCMACQSRFDRIPLEEFEPKMGDTTTDHDLLTFGTHMGHTYRQVWDRNQNYCQWILQTAENGDSSQQLRRFAQYVARMEQQMGFAEVLAGSLDEEL